MSYEDNREVWTEVSEMKRGVRAVVRANRDDHDAMRAVIRQQAATIEALAQRIALLERERAAEAA